MIKIELEPWEESDIKERIVERISDTIISREFKLYGDIPDEGCYTPYDKFKNYVANLVADRIFKYMIENPEIRKRIDTAIDKAEESIVATVVKNRRAGERMSDDRYLVAVELKNKHIDILKRALGGGENEDYWDDLENISESIIVLIEQVGEMV